MVREEVSSSSPVPCVSAGRTSSPRVRRFLQGPTHLLDAPPHTWTLGLHAHVVHTPVTLLAAAREESHGGVPGGGWSPYGDGSEVVYLGSGRGPDGTLLPLPG